jgi:hypothetical protein
MQPEIACCATTVIIRSTPKRSRRQEYHQMIHGLAFWDLDGVNALCVMPESELTGVPRPQGPILWGKNKRRSDRASVEDHHDHRLEASDVGMLICNLHCSDDNSAVVLQYNSTAQFGSLADLSAMHFDTSFMIVIDDTRARVKLPRLYPAFISPQRRAR